MQCVHPDCITTQTVLECTWSDCPEDVIAEVRELWRQFPNLVNDYSYFRWDIDEEDGVPELADDFPVIAKYLASRGVTKCLIHYWW